MPANRVPRLVIAPHDHYAELRYSDLLGGDVAVIGPFRTVLELRRAIASACAPYPGDHWPSVRRYSIERETDHAR